MTDFDRITPCGGDCTGCSYYLGGNCKGCRENGGKCVSMWENGCKIFECCSLHNALFCGVCAEFPCGWLESKLSEWDKDGTERLKKLGEEYIRENENGQT